ncbi:coiled-coil domain-containing protein [Planktothrix mougeotii]|uniref:MFS transporter n=1 Tax=Planktothrix mougeotii LEGE 06226 TaxID=1828728 RepID=A0ABR9UDD5_9CYAN|nr:MFS transporter [Planktothrix mougeotii]MBE9144482.1 MFS transporter [Planktothrix mougeotii LEGE 06226]
MVKTLELIHLTTGLIAQFSTNNTNVDTVEEAALVFSGPQFFTALISGVVLAFGIQLLLTNLGVAAGISNLGNSSSSDSDDHKSSSVGGTLKKVGKTLGIATVITVTLALFVACLLAVKLSLLTSPTLGAIVGLVIWATYFSLLVWMSSSTVGSMIGSVFQTTSSGIQSLFGMASAAFTGAAASKQIVATAEAAASAVRRELTAGIDPITMREQVEEYLEKLRPPQLNLPEIRREFETILNDPNLKEMGGQASLPNFTRQTFIDLAKSRTDLSRRDVERIADQLESVWRQTVGKMPQPQDMMGEFVNYLKTATSQQLLGTDLNKKIDDLIAQQKQNNPNQPTSMMSQGLTMSLNSLIGLVLGRSDLSDFDVEKILNQLNRLKSQVGEQTHKIAHQLTAKESYSPIKADVENYLLNTYFWDMKPQQVEQDFRDIIYDPNADPELTAEQLHQLKRTDFVNLLRQRGVFTQARIKELADQLEAIRLQVLRVTEEAIEQEMQLTVLGDVEHYMITTPADELTSEKILLNLKPILEDNQVSFEQLSQRLAPLTQRWFELVLQKRGDLSSDDVLIVAANLDRAKASVLEESEHRQAEIKANVTQQWLQVKSYLRDTGKAELNPDGIETNLRTLFEHPKVGMAAIRERISQFDRDTLVQLLTTRNDLSEAEVERILDQIESTWLQVRYTPERLIGKAQQQYDQAMNSIADYLRNTGKDELNPEGIQRDLNLLLEDPKLGIRAIRRRLSKVDRDTLVQLLNQRNDLSEEQINQTIDSTLSTLQGIAKTPQRLARRTQHKVQDFQSALANYLRSTDREELNPAGIQRDLKLLLHDPRVGVESLRERLSHFDRETLVALLVQREDMTEAEANRIADQIFQVREQLLEQIHSIQQRIQSVMDGILDRIRNYLNSLERPELNYEGIRDDIRTLFDDPQAGFEALRSRLSQFDRNTLVALLSSREDISEADANRIIDQIERSRNRVLQRAERLQMDAQMRVEQVKREAQHQLEETRKAAAAAAWWLFFTASLSAIAAAGAGALAVIG